MEYETSCGFVLINSDTKKILILKNSKNFGWDLPKGHQEKNKTIIETAFREVKEEVQIDKFNIKIINDNKNNPINSFYEYKSPETDNIRKVYLFIGLTTQNPIISHEHCGFAWCNLEEALYYLKFDEIKNCVNKLYFNIISKLN